MELRCGGCKRLLAIIDTGTFVDGSIAIKCKWCKFINILKGELSECLNVVVK